MAKPIELLLQRYAPRTPNEYENALKEIIQEITLTGLARAQFFNHAAFYGGSALRIFYGLSRFSEDLDFTLLKPNAAFKLTSYFTSVIESLHSFGFDVEINEIRKIKNRPVKSAFLKANTRIHLFKITSARSLAEKVPSNKVMQVKFEVDTSPAMGFLTEVKPMLPPVGASVKILKPASLFSEKMDAVLFRNWKQRVKGRDFYDLLWYLGQKIPLNLEYLRQKMVAGERWPSNKPFTRDDVVRLLKKRIVAINWKNAQDDVVNFLRDPQEIRDWSVDYFLSAVELLRTEQNG